ncbi:SCO family protein [Halodesulfovibrio sp. MK-HDV]|uniref:SCO family protein n=1 Tax=Halodesulfovibrio sp. MK-HDV TaxID=2599925 RepID=UPI0013700BC4|nr:SCO family protein [Halodesulfovibrio sp. MK-HDV]KAF1074770.1 hypothetical protein MKHDV_02564 [Halodesulfovibrio sp. MK-HDV]
MSVFKQRGFIRILRFAVIAAFALFLLVSLSRAEEPVQKPNQSTEAQSPLQDSSDHMNHSAPANSPSTDSPQKMNDQSSQMHDVHSGSDATDNAGHSLHINTKNREGSVLPPNDGSVPDMSGHVHPTPAPDSVEAGVTERLGETITTPIYFTDSTGKRVDIRSLMTSPVLIAPVYYSCPGVCHILMSSIAGVLPSVRLSPDKDYRIIMVSFDELDTPELAAKKKKNFMHALHAADPSFPPDAWKFLTGDKQSIDTLMGEIGFRFKRIGKDFVHPVILVAVSPEGRITRYLYGTNILPFDVTMALTESETDTPLFSVQRIAQLCFSYDPKGKKYVFDTMKIAGFGVIGFVVILALILSFGGKKKRKKKREE